MVEFVETQYLIHGILFDRIISDYTDVQSLNLETDKKETIYVQTDVDINHILKLKNKTIYGKEWWKFTETCRQAFTKDPKDRVLIKNVQLEECSVIGCHLVYDKKPASPYINGENCFFNNCYIVKKAWDDDQRGLFDTISPVFADCYFEFCMNNKAGNIYIKNSFNSVFDLKDSKIGYLTFENCRGNLYNKTCNIDIVKNVINDGFLFQGCLKDC